MATGAVVDPDLIPMHPEAAEDPTTVTWVLPSCPHDLMRAANHPGGPLGRLIDDGVLVTATGGPGWIRTSVGEASDWKSAAGPVRRAVRQTAVLVLEGHGRGDSSGASEGGGLTGGAVGDEAAGAVGLADEDLNALAQHILAEHITPIAGAHGGRITVVSADGDVVRVELAGACHGCPAAVFTLKQRFERLLQRTVPGVRVVEV